MVKLFTTFPAILIFISEQSNIILQHHNVKRYIEFIYAGIGGTNPLDDLHGQIILDKNKFLKSIEKLSEEKIEIAEIPRMQRFVLQNPTVDFSALVIITQEINKIIYELHYKNGAALNQIAKIFSLHPSTISKIINVHS